MNILVLTYWSYKEPLIQTYTLPYLKIINKYLPSGSKIYLQTLEKSNLKLSKKEFIKETELLQKENIYLIPFSYSKFGLKAIIKWKFYLLRLLVIIFSKKIKCIHCWCTPAGVIGYILSVLTGRSLIIDSYEPHAESIVENGDWKRNSFAFKILFFFEKLQSRRAKAVIAATKGFENWAKIKYKTEFENYYVKPACTDFNQFSSQPAKDEMLIKKFGFENKIVCVYAGKIGGIYLEKEIFDFFKAASDFWKEKFCVLLLTDTDKEKIEKYISASGLNPEIIFSEYIDHKEMHKYLGLADFALNPVKPVPTKRFCTSIKDGEYWAMGLPIVITQNISDDSEIIEKYKIGSIIKDFTYDKYIEAIEEIDSLLRNTDRQTLKNKIVDIAKQYRSFEIADEIYKKIYKNN
ncbi:MAG: glycosyltransferase [Bacteroidales bacterium]|nr:glycosyltransferase [Bacteroidales bacterium]